MTEPSRIAVLRAVNVGGRSMPMADLRAMASAIGLEDVRTLLQSGNLVFRGGPPAEAALEQKLEEAIQQAFGYFADCLVRDVAEWDAIIAHNPFPDEAAKDPGRLIVMPMKAKVTAAGLEALRAAIKGPEYVEAWNRAAYLVYPRGSGESKMTIRVIERCLGSIGTGRNWNTMQKLATLAKA